MLGLGLGVEGGLGRGTVKKLAAASFCGGCRAVIYGSKYLLIIYFPKTCSAITFAQNPSTKLLGTWTVWVNYLKRMKSAGLRAPCLKAGFQPGAPTYL